MHRYSESAPTTGRSANRLARKYGFDNSRQMANSLPEGALVADFGSGRSDLGEVITGMRGDVRWLNIDIRRGLFGHTRRHQRTSGPGLQYVKANVFNPPIKPGTLDRVYSSWLLPHIELDSRALALDAVHNMASLLNEDGILSLDATWTVLRRQATVSAAEYHDSPDEVANQVVDTLALNGITRQLQILINVSNEAFNLHRLP